MAEDVDSGESECKAAGVLCLQPMEVGRLGVMVRHSKFVGVVLSGE